MMDVFLLLLLIICAVAAITMRNLMASGMILAIYSLLMAVIWTRMNAVDVAFTEASVGAGITSVLLIATISRTHRKEAPSKLSRRAQISILVLIVTAAVLFYGTIDMPMFGDPNAPDLKHVAPRYIWDSAHETGVINIVTAVLASYRGYDTLGETSVIFAAGASVVLLLRRHKEDTEKELADSMRADAEAHEDEDEEDDSDDQAPDQTGEPEG